MFWGFSQNGLVGQLKPFQKPCFIVVFEGLYDGLKLWCPKC